MLFLRQFITAFFDHWEQKAAGAVMIPLIAFCVSKWGFEEIKATTSLETALISFVIYFALTVVWYLIRTPFLIRKERLGNRVLKLGREINKFLASLPPKPPNTDRMAQVKWVEGFHNRFKWEFDERVRRVKAELDAEEIFNPQFSKDVIQESRSIEEITRIANALIAFSVDIKASAYRKRLQQKLGVVNE